MWIFNKSVMQIYQEDREKPKKSLASQLKQYNVIHIIRYYDVLLWAQLKNYNLYMWYSCQYFIPVITGILLQSNTEGCSVYVDVIGK